MLVQCPLMELSYDTNRELREIMIDNELSASDVARIINHQAGSDAVAIWTVYAWRKNYSGRRRMRELYLALLKRGLGKKRPLEKR